jgi:biotin carboxyl carrier protein
MDLTNEDVADVLALLDSLPYDELDLQTTRFRLILRRTPDGWTQSVESRSAPEVLDPAPAGGAATPAGGAATPAGGAATPAGGAAAAAGGAAAAAGGAAATRVAATFPAPPITGSVEHRAGYNRLDGASSRLGSDADGADETEVATGVVPDEGRAGRKGADAGPELVAVRTPLPGTFYRAPRPGAAPFVEVGSRVDPDTVVGIVETMKLMNSVSAGVDGTVAEICLGNAEFAGHGATLLRIRVD